MAPVANLLCGNICNYTEEGSERRTRWLIMAFLVIKQLYVEHTVMIS